MSILVAVDGDRIPDQVVDVGADLASKFGEELIVIHVMPQDAYESRAPGGSRTAMFEYPTATEVSYWESTDADTQSYSIDEAQQDAQGVAQNVTAHTLEEVPDSVRYVGRVGDVVTEVLAVVDDRDPRYLVVGRRDRSPVGKAVFGSVTQSLLLNANVPVVTVIHEE